MKAVYSVDKYIMDRFNGVTIDSLHIGMCESMVAAEYLATKFIVADIHHNTRVSIDKSPGYIKFAYEDGRCVVEVIERPLYGTTDEIDEYIENIPTFKSK